MLDHENLARKPTNPWDKKYPFRELGQNKCDHWVYLEECDFKNNIFKVWTWGKQFYLTERGLLGAGTIVEGAPYTNGLVCTAINW